MRRRGSSIAAYEKIPASSPLRILVDIRRAQNLNELGKIDEAKAVLVKLLDDADHGKLVAKGAGPKPNPVLDQLRAARLPQQALGVGRSGNDVRDLQNVLKLLGVNAGPVDGYYGLRTRRGVAAIQRRLGVPADGIAGPMTVKRLQETLTAAIAAEAAQNRGTATDGGAPLKPAARIRIYEALAGMLRARKRYKEAIDYYTKIMAMIPEPQKYHWTIWYARGTSYERSNDWASAERDLLRAMELNPDQPLVLNYLGYSWVDQGKNLTRGLSLISRAVQLKPDDGFIVDSLGWAYYRLGRYDEAVKHLERAVELQPSDPVLNDHLGDAMWRAGRQREARFQWELALTLKPEQKVIDEIRKKLLTGLPPEPAKPTLVLPKSEEKAKPLGKRAETGVEHRTR